MAERERLSLGNGVSVYREYEAWSVEVSRRGNRRRWSLKTRDRGVALIMAGNLLRELNAREASIELDYFKLIAPPECHGPTLAESLCPPVLVPNPAAERLRDLAFEGVRVEDIIVRNAIRHGVGPEPKPASPQKVLDEYEASLVDEGLDEDHIGIVVSIIRHLLDDTKVESLSKLTEEMVRNHLRTLKSGDGNQPPTLKKKLKRIISFLEFAKAPTRGYVVGNVAAGIKPPKVGKVENEAYSKEELEGIFRKVRGLKIEKVILMAFWTGLDKKDLEILDAKEIRLDTRRIVGRRHKTNKKRREGVPIFDAVLDVVKKLPREGRVFSEWKDLEYVGQVARGMGISFRKLRRSFVSHLRSGGVNPDVVCRWACHTREVEEDYVCPTGEPMPFTFLGKQIPSHGHLEVPKSALRKVED